MKITYYIRDPREGNYSLEKIFHGVGDVLALENDVQYFYANNKKSKLWNIREASWNQGDINHITGDVNWLSYGLKRNKTIITAHDLGHYTNTLKGLKRFVYGLLWWKWPLRKVVHVTAISNFTKSQLIDFFNIQSNKVSVIHDPLTLNFEKSDYSFNTNKPTILQVGSMPNKNINRLIEAVKDIPCKLLLLRMYDQALSEKLQSFRIDHTFHTNVSDVEVINLYRKSDIVYFASTYEGFGLPIIESQAIGRPVLTSHMQPMPEVAGKAAHFVDPYNVDEIRSGILKIINDKDYRDNLINLGFANVVRFDIRKIAQQYLDLYNKLIAN